MQKKFVEVTLKEKGTKLHAATVVGDTVGDPYTDTSSVSLNPIIKSQLYLDYWLWKFQFQKHPKYGPVCWSGFPF